MAKIPRVPVENQVTTLSVVKIAIKFSPCINSQSWRRRGSQCFGPDEGCSLCAPRVYSILSSFFSQARSWVSDTRVTRSAIYSGALRVLQDQVDVVQRNASCVTECDRISHGLIQFRWNQSQGQICNDNDNNNPRNKGGCNDRVRIYREASQVDKLDDANHGVEYRSTLSPNECHRISGVSLVRIRLRDILCSHIDTRIDNG